MADSSQLVLSLIITKSTNFKIPNARPKKRHHAGSVRTKLFSSDFEKPGKCPKQMVLDDVSGDIIEIGQGNLLRVIDIWSGAAYKGLCYIKF